MLQSSDIINMYNELVVSKGPYIWFVLTLVQDKDTDGSEDDEEQDDEEDDEVDD